LYSSLEYIRLHLFYKGVLSILHKLLAVMFLCRVYVLTTCLLSPVYRMHVWLVAKKIYFLSLGNKDTSCMI